MSAKLRTWRVLKWSLSMAFVLSVLVMAFSCTHSVPVWHSSYGQIEFAQGELCRQMGDVFVTIVPLWPISAALGFAAVAFWILDQRPSQPGRCHKCGYDLTGNVSGRCPECGWRVKKAETST